ncbi:hypothetical protein [Streptomyces parvus]|uniref:hypothetical protein n=1 Tax=Streptomyces parvus TaxID=66428 RepID=UPI0033EC0DCA
MTAPLADASRMPLEIAAAVYEADGANVDFLEDFLQGGRTLHQCDWLRDYREAAEAVMNSGFAVLRTAEALEATLSTATARVRRADLSGIPRVALDSLTAIHADLTDPERAVLEPAPLHLVHALEDVCEDHSVITPDERATCVHHRLAVDCCA